MCSEAFEDLMISLFYGTVRTVRYSIRVEESCCGVQSTRGKPVDYREHKTTKGIVDDLHAVSSSRFKKRLFNEIGIGSDNLKLRCSVLPGAGLSSVKRLNRLLVRLSLEDLGGKTLLT